MNLVPRRIFVRLRTVVDFTQALFAFAGLWIIRWDECEIANDRKSANSFFILRKIDGKLKKISISDVTLCKAEVCRLICTGHSQNARSEDNSRLWQSLSLYFIDEKRTIKKN